MRYFNKGQKPKDKKVIKRHNECDLDEYSRQVQSTQVTELKIIDTIEVDTQEATAIIVAGVIITH